MNRRVILVILAVAFVVALAFVGIVTMGVFAVFRLMDSADGHVCGLAMVRRSPVAVRLVGTPIEQKGFTGGSTSTDNGETKERLTFTVRGPRGEAFVLSEGRRSPLSSHLLVSIGRDQRSEIVYSGPFDCPELHEKTR